MEVTVALPSTHLLLASVFTECLLHTRRAPWLWRFRDEDITCTSVFSKPLFRADIPLSQWSLRFQGDILEVSSEVAPWTGIREPPVLARPILSRHCDAGPLTVVLCRVFTSGSTTAMRMPSRLEPARVPLMRTPRKVTSLTRVRDREWEELQFGATMMAGLLCP